MTATTVRRRRRWILCSTEKKNDFVRKWYYEREPVVAIHNTTTAYTFVWESECCLWTRDLRSCVWRCVRVSVCVKHYYYVLYEPLVYTTELNVYIGVTLWLHLSFVYTHLAMYRRGPYNVYLSHSYVWTSKVFICEDRICTRGFFSSCSSFALCWTKKSRIYQIITSRISA